jgi:GNAT superfamily N-acetyltransferase
MIFLNESSIRMTAPIQPQHDLSPVEIDAIEERIYNHNHRAIGRNDGRRLAFVIRDETGRMIGVAAGYTWAGSSELKQMWIDEAFRGRGYARELLNAFVAEAASRTTVTRSERMRAREVNRDDKECRIGRKPRPGILKIAKELGIGTSTVQRIACSRHQKSGLPAFGSAAPG